MAFVPSFLRHSTFTPYFSRNLCTRPLSSSEPLKRIHQHSKKHVSTTTTATLLLPDNPVIGFIGLGVMGMPMAQNITKQYANVNVWNRSDKQLPSEHMQKVQTPAQVIQQSHITFSMLSTPEAVQSVFYDHDSAALSADLEGKCIVDCSTLQIKDMQKTYDHVNKKGGYFMEAPVSGSKVPAELGQLIFLCAGDKLVFDHHVTQSILDLMGKRSFFLGNVGNGTKMKLVANQLMATMMAALGESIVLTEALDLSVPDFLEVLSLGAMNNPMFSLKGPKMKYGEKGYDTNFPLEHAQKDVRFAQALGDDHGISMSVNSAANEWYKAAKGLGLNRDDFCAVIESIRASSGKQ